jgi:hypothetical protein
MHKGGVLAIVALAIYAAWLRRRLAAEQARGNMYHTLVTQRERELAQLGR